MAIPSATRRVKPAHVYGGLGASPLVRRRITRELKRQQRYPHGAPVVFTSNLGRSLYSSRAESPLGEPEWGISQTPQVWIDHLAFEHHGEVWLQWDSNDALFLRR